MVYLDTAALAVAAYDVLIPIAQLQNKDPQVDLKTSVGTIRVELYPGKAPKTVDNFLKYVKDGHYNGTIFHRVIPGFMVQGGGMTPDMAQKVTECPPLRDRPAARVSREAVAEVISAISRRCAERQAETSAIGARRFFK